MLPALTPMRLLRIPEPFDHPDFVFEPKIDGFRAVGPRARASVRARLAQRTRVQILASALRRNCPRRASNGLRAGWGDLLPRTGRPQPLPQAPIPAGVAAFLRV
jgi:hypothetical protein